MNTYGIIILATLIISFIIENLADYLNLKALSPDLPGEFKGVYDDEKYSKSQEYTRIRTKFGFITSVFGLVLILVFWFAGGFPYLQTLTKSVTDNEILKGLFFITVLMLANSIINMPFSIYSTFVIENKFGFNTTTVKTFLLDLVKGLGLSLVIGLPVLALILYILINLGSYAAPVAWVTTILIMMIMQYAAPVIFLPMFNKFEPLEDGELRTAIEELSVRQQFPIKNIFVMDGSKRSRKSNAFFIGFGKNKRIVLFDTLINQCTTDELVGVMAHEIGHYKKKHITWSMVISNFHIGIIFYLFQMFVSHQGLHQAFYMNEVTIYGGLIFFTMLYSPIEIILSLMLNKLSRKNEYEADSFAVESTNKPESMISALKKLSVNNLSNLTPHPFYVFLNYSHPTVMERIEAIRKIKISA